MISCADVSGVDGYLARALNQKSDLGAWVCYLNVFSPQTNRISQLDVVVDNIGRSLIWCLVAPVRNIEIRQLLDSTLL